MDLLESQRSAPRGDAVCEVFCLGGEKGNKSQLLDARDDSQGALQRMRPAALFSDSGVGPGYSLRLLGV